MKIKRVKIQLAARATYWEETHGAAKPDYFVNVCLMVELNFSTVVADGVCLEQALVTG